MIEGDHHDGPEAGPSTWRRQSQASEDMWMSPGSSMGSTNGYRSTRSKSDDDAESDTAEILRDEEAEQLEDTLIRRHPYGQRQNTTTALPAASSSGDSFELTSEKSQTQQTLPRTPSQSSLRSRPRVHKRHSSSANYPYPHSLSHLDLPVPSDGLRSSSSEIFNIFKGGNNGIASGATDDDDDDALTRQTTYSSLPPSPRLDAPLDFDLTPVKRIGIGINGIEDILANKLNHEVIDTFWPARSRRPTIDADGHGAENGDSEEPTSPISPVTPISPIALDSPTVDPDISRLGEEASSDRQTSGVASLWDLLKDAEGEEEWEGWVVDGKWDRITNFLAVPIAMEKVTLFGALLCLDGFLYNFTVLPIRAAVAASRMVNNLVHRQPIWPIAPSHLQSILRVLLLIIPTAILLVATDASKMYHSVRGQDTIKLYVIFNALEIADRLCGAFGQDVLDTLFARETLFPTDRKIGKGRKRQQARPVFFFMLSLGYVLAHTLIFFYMLVSLNVAINSYDYTLLSLLISNQFVEIKGSVFKKFEKENLFQILCADIVERFQLSLMLCVIALRNMIEMAGSEIAFLPKSFMKGKSLVDSIFSPVLFVIISEMMVDWLKHAFITKFNHVRSTVYGRYADILAKDVLVAGSLTGGRNRAKGRSHPVLLDQSPLVARRLGFASIPLACLVLRIGLQAIGMLTTSSHHHDDPTAITSDYWWLAIKWIAMVGVGISGWACAVALKVLLGLGLLSYSALRRAGMEKREEEDRVNDFGRQPVGESKEETEYNKQTTKYLSKVQDDLRDHPSPTSTRTATFDSAREAGLRDEKRVGGEQLVTPAAEDKGGKKGKKWKLEEVERWTMVKRIW